MKKFFSVILIGSLFLGLYASDDDFFFSDDSMFFEETIEEFVPDTENQKESTIFDFGIVETDSVSFGGSTSFSLDFSSIWLDAFSSENDKDYWFKGFENSSLAPNMFASLHFDARPNEALRFYGKTEVSYPNNSNQPIFQFKVKELFTDFNVGEHSYYRFGKHTVKWGVGYFFSPVDVINIGKIDPENPENQVEGAVSLRSMYTFSGNQNCLYLYLIPDESFLAKNTAFAGKYDFLVGNSEIGVGAWLRYNRPPRLVSTLTTTLFKNYSIFGEGVLAYGTEEQWLESSNKDLVFQGTLGFSRSFSKQKINLSAQYLFNGFGVDNPTDLDDITFLSKAMLYNNIGKHYLAVSLSKSELFTKKLSVSGLCLMSFSDFSGMGNLNFNVNLNNNCNISFGPSLIFGKENAEYTRIYGIKEGLLQFKASVKLGGGKF